MSAEEEHGAILIEDVLRSVAMMHVPINNRYMMSAIHALRMAGGNGDIIEDTETHASALTRMVPGRPNGTERVVDFAAEHGINRGNGTTGCKAGYFR